MNLNISAFICVLSIMLTVVNSQPANAGGADSHWYASCVDNNLVLNGDFQKSNIFTWIKEGQWSVGPSVNTQLIKYDIAKEKAGFNTSVGIGAAFRFYPTITIKNVDVNGNGTIEKNIDVNGDGHIDEYEKNDGEHGVRVNISQTKTLCRQNSFGVGNGQDPSTGKDFDYYSAPAFSITPTLYATKPVADDDLSLQPALLLGFFEDIINIGVGFNLTGEAGEKGNVFLLMGIGYGFRF